MSGRGQQPDMGTKVDPDLPQWVLSPAKYSAPPTDPGDASEKEKVDALRSWTHCVILVLIIFWEVSELSKDNLI